MPDPRVIFQILADNKQAKKVLDDTATTFDKVGAGAQKLALPAAAVLGGIALGAFKAADAASEVEQSFGALESVFKENADAAKGLAGDAATSVGLATSDYAQLAAVLGAQLKGMGTASDELVGKTDRLIDTGADLAATFGGSTADAVAAISSLLRGERDPIEKYGVAIKEVDVNAQLLADGVATAAQKTAALAKANDLGDAAAIAAAKSLRVLEGDALVAAKAEATLNLLTRKTADAQGAFARETDTAAHAQQVANAQFEDAQAALGMALLPAVSAVANAMAGLAGWVKENTQLVQIIVGVVAIFAAGILALNAAIGIWNTLQTVWAAKTAIVTAAQWLLNAALLANPIGLVVIAIAALIAAIILLWNNCQEFRDVVTAVFNAVRNVIGGVVDFIVRLFSTLVDIFEEPFNALLGVVRSVFGLVKSVVDLALRFVVGLFTKLMTVLKPIIDPLLKLLTGPFEKAKTIIAGIFKALEKIVRDVVGAISGFLDGIAKTIDDVAGAIDNVNPFSATGPSGGGGGGAAGVAVPRVGGLRAARAGGSSSRASGPITVNVYTTGDGMQAEQAVLRALRRQTRINGGVVPAFGWSGAGGPSLARLGGRPSPQPSGG